MAQDRLPLLYLDFRDLGPGEDSRSGLIRLREREKTTSFTFHCDVLYSVHQVFLWIVLLHFITNYLSLWKNYSELVLHTGLKQSCTINLILQCSTYPVRDLKLTSYPHHQLTTVLGDYIIYNVFLFSITMIQSLLSLLETEDLSVTLQNTLMTTIFISLILQKKVCLWTNLTYNSLHTMDIIIMTPNN